VGTGRGGEGRGREREGKGGEGGAGQVGGVGRPAAWSRAAAPAGSSSRRPVEASRASRAHLDGIGSGSRWPSGRRRRRNGREASAGHVRRARVATRCDFVMWLFVWQLSSGSRGARRRPHRRGDVAGDDVSPSLRLGRSPMRTGSSRGLADLERARQRPADHCPVGALYVPSDRFMTGYMCLPLRSLPRPRRLRRWGSTGSWVSSLCSASPRAKGKCAWL